MKKILTFALAALMIISMTGCAGNDNTQKEQEKVVTSFFDNIKEYKLDELEKLGTDDYTDVLDISSITDGFKNFEDENVYGESFVKETENFVKKVFDKLIKEYKMDDYELIDNREDHQYEFHIGKLVPKIEYIKNKTGEIYLTHTEVPVQLEGKGVGSQLVEKVLKDIEKQELRLVPLCPFVAGYIKKHPDWRRIVMKGINVG